MMISCPLGLHSAHLTDNTSLGATALMSACTFPVMLFLPTFKYAEPDDVFGPTQTYPILPFLQSLKTDDNSMSQVVHNLTSSLHMLMDL